jgi:hypothetical protein
MRRFYSSTRLARPNTRPCSIWLLRGWLWLHESGTYLKFTQEGANLFA